MSEAEQFRGQPAPRARLYPGLGDQSAVPTPEMSREAAFDYIGGWLENHQRAFKYGYYVHDFRREAPLGVPLGLYGNTNVFGHEIASDITLQAAYTTIYTTSLSGYGLIQRGQLAHVIPVDEIYCGPEQYVMLRIDVLNASTS